MSNKKLTIFGAGLYILRVLSSATDLDGNPQAPPYIRGWFSHFHSGVNNAFVDGCKLVTHISENWNQLVWQFLQWQELNHLDNRPFTS